MWWRVPRLPIHMEFLCTNCIFAGQSNEPIRFKNIATGNIMNRKIACAVLGIAPLLIGATGAGATAGPATLSGQAFVIAPGGERVSCAGREITIAPDSAAASGSSVRHAMCDDQGRFVFPGLAAQGWTIRTIVTWQVRAKQGLRQLGGTVAQHVVLRPGDNVIAVGGEPGAFPSGDELAGSQASR
jgi:hypothetical protein